MAKSLLKLLLLGALSAGASSLPNMLGGLSALPAAPLSGLPAAGASGENARETARELADLQRTVEELKGLNSARPKSVAGLSEEERGLMQDAAPKLKFKSNALTRQLGLAGGGKRAGPSPAALPGAAYLAAAANVPILPVAITGTEKIKGKWWFFKPRRIGITIGRPFYLTAGDEKPDKEKLGVYGDRIMSAIAEILPPEYRGIYGDTR